MKLWKWLLSPAMTLALVIPGTVYAQGEVADDAEDYKSSFQNPIQAERAQRIAEASFDEAAAEAIAEQQAEDYVKQVASDYADGVVEKISSDHADRIVHETSLAYATEQADASPYMPGSDEYNAVKDDAYNDAKARATAEGDWENLRETAYNDAKARATAEGDWENARETAYNYAYARATAEGDWENAKETAYRKALAEEIGRLTELQLAEVKRLRLDEGFGWGVLVKLPGIELHPSINGRGRYKKMKGALPVDEIAPRDPEAIPLDAEIREATRRDTRTGWIDDPELQAMDNTKKGKKKKYALTQTSGLASEDVRGNSKGINGNTKNKSNVGNSGKKDSTTYSQATASNKSKNNNGNKGSKSSNSNKGGNKGDNGNSNKGGNNGNNGNNGKGNK